MLRLYFLTIFRKIKRDKTSFLINIVGLSSGLTCALLIYLWVHDEINMNRFNENDSRFYQVMHNMKFSQGDITTELTPYPLAQALVEEFPEVEQAVAIKSDFFNWRSGDGIITYEDRNLETCRLIADQNFFMVFPFQLLQGDKDKVLRNRNEVVISKALAKKLFGNTDNIIGKSVTWKHPGFSGTFQISGIFERPPQNSTNQFDIIFNMAMLLDNDPFATRWENCYVETYLLLKEGTDIDQFNEKIADFTKSKAEANAGSSIFAQRYSSKYLHGQYENGEIAGGRIAYVRLFSFVALFILILACINFMNLSTAKALGKLKEIGVKKVTGARRRILVFQYLGESVIMTTLSFIIALILVYILLPHFNSITSKSIELRFTPEFIFVLMGIVLLTGLLAGSYPAFYLSGFNPVAVLKGKLNTSFGELWIRKGLIIFQFALSLIFIVGFLAINKQIEYTRNKNLGYNRDNILCFQWKEPVFFLQEENARLDLFLSKIKGIPGVLNATTATGGILNDISLQSGISWRGQEEDKKYIFQSPIVSYDYLETMGMEIIEGRSFLRDFNDNYSRIILNETAVKMMDIEDPVGKIIDMNGKSQIVGVVKDFNAGSLHNTVKPLIFRFLKYNDNVLVKIQGGSEIPAIENLKLLHKEFFPEYPFEFTFMDDDYQALYESEIKTATLSKYFAAIAIIISCLGLFGMATFSAHRRKKEISVRKVHGSTSLSIVWLLSADFSQVVLIAILISAPLSYLIIKNWLNNFAYKIELEWWLFAAAAFITLLVAWITVSSQALKAASTNPAICLKDE